MKTLQLINHIFQFPEIETVEFVSTSLTDHGDDAKVTAIQAIEHLSNYWDCPDMKWGINRLGNELVIFARSE